MSNLRQEQFLRVFRQHQLQIDAYVRALVANRADAEEIFQDVVAVLWREFDKFEPGTRFDHWAYRVAKNRMLYFFRRQRREASAFADYLFSTVADEAARQNDLWSDRQEALQTCLQKLSHPDRQLIQQRFGESKTNRGVARQTGRSETAISRALNRIYSNLLDCIQRRLDCPAKETIS